MQELEGFSERRPVFRLDAEIADPWILEMDELAAGGNRRIHQRPEDILPAQQAVREYVEAGLLLQPDERREVLGEGRLHRVRIHPAAVETAGRRHNLFGAWVDAVLIRKDVDGGEFRAPHPCPPPEGEGNGCDGGVDSQGRWNSARPSPSAISWYPSDSRVRS